jgi:hypothetical protein
VVSRHAKIREVEDGVTAHTEGREEGREEGRKRLQLNSLTLRLASLPLPDSNLRLDAMAMAMAPF